METKRFDLGTVLTVVTGRLLTRRRGPNDNGIGDLYKILEWMTGEGPYTHQLGRFSNECKLFLLNAFPELKGACDALGDLDSLMEKMGIAGYTKWMLSLGLPLYFEVPKMPATYHLSKDPIDELEEMREK